MNRADSVVAQTVKNLPVMWESWVQSVGWEDPPEEGNGYPLQCSGLENSMNFIVHGVTKSQAELSNFHYSLFLSHKSIMSIRVGTGEKLCVSREGPASATRAIPAPTLGPETALPQACSPGVAAGNGAAPGDKLQMRESICFGT